MTNLDYPKNLDYLETVLLLEKVTGANTKKNLLLA